MPWNVELQAALETGARASELIRKEYETFELIPDAPASISTHVDKASQELILEELHARFPADALCAEETMAGLPNVPKTARRVWVVDPIDGTRGFAKKTGQFSVMIGLLDQGQPVVGVVIEPALGRITYASLGGGCWAKDGSTAPTACQVSRRGKLVESILVQSWSKPGQPSKAVQAIRPGSIVETYSGGVKLARVARGECDIYANTYERFFDWDICAGHVLVTEAGGMVTNLAGGAIAYGEPDFGQGHGLLATNGAVHQAVIEKILAAA